MLRKRKLARDPNQRAKAIVDIATGEIGAGFRRPKLAAAKLSGATKRSTKTRPYKH
jgi:hypothetical protein